MYSDEEGEVKDRKSVYIFVCKLHMYMYIMFKINLLAEIGAILELLSQE